MLTVYKILIFDQLIDHKLLVTVNIQISTQLGAYLIVGTYWKVGTYLIVVI